MKNKLLITVICLFSFFAIGLMSTLANEAEITTASSTTYKVDTQFVSLHDYGKGTFYYTDGSSATKEMVEITFKYNIKDSNGKVITPKYIPTVRLVSSTGEEVPIHWQNITKSGDGKTFYAKIPLDLFEANTTYQLQISVSPNEPNYSSFDDYYKDYFYVWTNNNSYINIQSDPYDVRFVNANHKTEFTFYPNEYAVNTQFLSAKNVGNVKYYNSNGTTSTENCFQISFKYSIKNAKDNYNITPYYIPSLRVIDKNSGDVFEIYWKNITKSSDGTTFYANVPYDEFALNGNYHLQLHVHKNEPTYKEFSNYYQQYFDVWTNKNSYLVYGNYNYTLDYKNTQSYATFTLKTETLNTADNYSYSIHTNTNNVYLNTSNDNIVMNLNIMYENDLNGAKTPISANTPPKVVLDQDGNLNTTDDQIQPVSVTRDPNNANNWIVNFDQFSLVDAAEYKVIAQLPYSPDNTSTNLSEQVYTQQTTRYQTESNNTLSVINRNNKLSVSYTTRDSNSIETTVNDVYLNTTNHDLITMELQIHYYNDFTGGTSCISNLTPPSVVLDVDGNLSTTNDQVQPNDINREAINCENWTVNFNRSDLTLGQQYKVLAKLPSDPDNVSQMQSEQIDYSSPTENLRDGYDTLALINDNNKLAITYASETPPPYYDIVTNYQSFYSGGNGIYYNADGTTKTTNLLEVSFTYDVTRSDNGAVTPFEIEPLIQLQSTDASPVTISIPEENVTVTNENTITVKIPADELEIGKTYTLQVKSSSNEYFYNEIQSEDQGWIPIATTATLVGNVEFAGESIAYQYVNNNNIMQISVYQIPYEISTSYTSLVDGGNGLYYTNIGDSRNTDRLKLTFHYEVRRTDTDRYVTNTFMPELRLVSTDGTSEIDIFYYNMSTDLTEATAYIPVDELVPGKVYKLQVKPNINEPYYDGLAPAQQTWIDLPSTATSDTVIQIGDYKFTLTNVNNTAQLEVTDTLNPYPGQPNRYDIANLPDSAKCTDYNTPGYPSVEPVLAYKSTTNPELPIFVSCIPESQMNFDAFANLVENYYLAGLQYGSEINQLEYVFTTGTNLAGGYVGGMTTGFYNGSETNNSSDNKNFMGSRINVTFNFGIPPQQQYVMAGYAFNHEYGHHVDHAYNMANNCNAWYFENQLSSTAHRTVTSCTDPSTGAYNESNEIFAEDYATYFPNDAAQTAMNNGWTNPRPSGVGPISNDPGGQQFLNEQFNVSTPDVNSQVLLTNAQIVTNQTTGQEQIEFTFDYSNLNTTNLVLDEAKLSSNLQNGDYVFIAYDPSDPTATVATNNTIAVDYNEFMRLTKGYGVTQYKRDLYVVIPTTSGQTLRFPVYGDFTANATDNAPLMWSNYKTTSIYKTNGLIMNDATGNIKSRINIK